MPFEWQIREQYRCNFIQNMSTVSSQVVYKEANVESTVANATIWLSDSK